MVAAAGVLHLVRANSLSIRLTCVFSRNNCQPGRAAAATMPASGASGRDGQRLLSQQRLLPSLAGRRRRALVGPNWVQDEKDTVVTSSVFAIIRCVVTLHEA